MLWPFTVACSQLTNGLIDHARHSIKPFINNNICLAQRSDSEEVEWCYNGRHGFSAGLSRVTIVQVWSFCCCDWCESKKRATRGRTRKLNESAPNSYARGWIKIWQVRWIARTYAMNSHGRMPSCEILVWSVMDPLILLHTFKYTPITEWLGIVFLLQRVIQIVALPLMELMGHNFWSYSWMW